MDYTERFVAKPNSTIKLSNIDPDFTDAHVNKKEALKRIEHNNLRLRELQELLYAEHKRSLLICLQAIDTGGKDGTIRHVIASMNPQGCNVAAFKPPNSLEHDHDFLWRAHRDMPMKGNVTVFNRSHYEDVLVVRIHGEVPKSIWAKRYDQINEMEKYLSANGTHIIKFFLHISKEEQWKRFKERLDDSSKHWKISEADYTERARWDEYQEAFNDMLSKCSTSKAPWYIIPANHKWFRDLAVSQILVEYLEGLRMNFPIPSVDIAQIRKKILYGKNEEYVVTILMKKTLRKPLAESHLINRIGWLRAAVLGANDGILSTASIVSGMAAGGASRSTILLAGLAGLVAGATSMATGEYVSVSSQADTENAELEREKRELQKNPVFELEELAQIYVSRGVTLHVAREVAAQLMAKDALAAHAHDELGISEITTARPVQAALSSAASFTVGALLPLAVAIISPPFIIVVTVIVSTLLSLAILGVVGAKTGGAHVLKPTLRVVFWGALSLGLTTFVGLLFGLKS